MRRALIIAISTVALFASDVAWAESPETPVRLPMTRSEGATLRQVTVEPGDHLWKISEKRLNATETDPDVAPYWRKVIDLNLPTLRSGDPDLIFPGELVTLPNPDG